nr:MAG TPA: putative head tail adaptor [Caudoviricetes sp.]
MDRIDIGTFDKEVECWKAAKSIGKSGETITEWKIEKKCFASVDFINTTEQLETQNIVSLAQIEVITYNAEFSQDWRLRYRGDFYNITAITPLSSLFIQINATKVMK